MRRIEVRSAADVKVLVGWIDTDGTLDLLDGNVVEFRTKPKPAHYPKNGTIPVSELEIIEIIKLRAIRVCEKQDGRSPNCWMALSDCGKSLDELHEILGFVECGK